MSVLKQYNSATGLWEPVVIGKQGPPGPTGALAATAPILFDSGTGTVSMQSSPTFTGNTTLVDPVTGGVTGPASGSWAAKVIQQQDASTANGLSVQGRWGTSASKILEVARGWNGTTAGYYPAFSVDGNGYTQNPYNPAIWLDGNSAAWANEGVRTVKKFNVVESRGNMVWNATTGTVTVPVAGWYSASFTIYQAANTTQRRHIRRNGYSRAMHHTYNYNVDNQNTFTTSFYCAANDTIDFYLEYTSNIYYGSTHTYASIIYLG